MQLVFDQRRIPRSTTRKEWREMDRWRRNAQRRIRERVEAQTAAFQVFGVNSRQGEEFMERLIRPPVLLSSHQEPVAYG